MNDNTEKLVGIKQVLQPEFDAAVAANKTNGYMWFVRNNNITLHNYIYLGSRLYGEADINIPFDSVITNVVNGDNSIIVTKTSTENGTTVELKLNLDPNGGLAITENGLQVDTTQFITKNELEVLVSAETTRAETAESNLQGNINIETTERRIDVSNLQGNINIETERALAAEKVLNDKIVDADITELVTKIETEIVERTNADIEINKNLETKVTWEKFGETRKTIVLGNDDMLLGTNVAGNSTYNLAMVNKWDVVDLGSTSLPINLNVPSGIRATVQEAGQSGEQANKIAYLTDIVDYSGEITANTKAIEDEVIRATDAETVLQTNIDTKVSSVELVQDQLNSLHYTLLVDTVVKGEINIPKDQFLKSVSFDETTHTLTFVFDTSDGEKSVEVDLNGLVEVYTAGNGLSLSDGAFSIVIDPLTQSFIEVSANGVKIVGINEAIAVETTRAETAETALDVKIETNTQSISVETARAKAAEQDNVDAIKGVRTDLTTETTARTADVNKLTIDLGSEVTRATNREDVINAKIDNIIDNGLTLKNGKSIMAEVTNPTGTPVNVLTVTTGNSINVGSNIGQLELESKGDIIAIIDGTNKTVAIKEDIQTLITTNTQAIEAEVTRAEAAEQANAALIANKVDKIDGMGLSETSFTTVDKAKLDSLTNYNDTALKADITANTQAIGAEVTRAEAAETALGIRVKAVEDKPVVVSNDITNMLRRTEAEYNAIPVKDPKTLYIIVG